MAARLLALLAGLARWLAASTLDYLKNRIPPALNCVSRLVFMYQHTHGWNNVGYSVTRVYAASAARLFVALDFDLRSVQILALARFARLNRLNKQRLFYVLF